MKASIPFETLVNRLRAYKHELPGEEAQWQLAPKLRKKVEVALQHDKAPKQSAVLLLLFPVHEETYFTLIQRNIYDGVHSGQISLPGGSFEKKDKNLQETALREAEEEIGIDAHRVEVLVQLSKLYIPPSNFMVQPFVGSLNDRPVFKPDPHEVADILEIALSDILDDARIKEGRIKLLMGATITAPYFDLKDKMVWGATAMMLSEFRVLIRQLISQNPEL